MGSCAPTAVPAPDGETPSGRLQTDTTSTAATKRKNRPAGTPDPDAEVVSLSPRTLLESRLYACEVCGQEFRREVNLEMHRRRHNLPWRLPKRDASVSATATRKVFVCPEPSCLYHHPSRALADITGIRKHFRRKHGACRQWACARCSRAYGVLVDYKAHVKTCGTRARRPQAGVGASVSSEPVSGVAAAGSSTPHQQAQTARSPCRSSPSLSPSSDAVAVRKPAGPGLFHQFLDQAPTPLSDARGVQRHNLELLLMPMPPSCYAAAKHSPQAPISRADNDVATELRLSIGFCSCDNRAIDFRPSPVAEPLAQVRR